MTNQLDPEVLAQFTGSNKFYKFSKQSPNTLLSEGAAYVAKHGGRWLMDMIAKVQQYKKTQNIPYQVWYLSVKDDKSASVLAQTSSEWLGEFGGDEYGSKSFYWQDIPSTDFDPKGIMLYVVTQGDYRIIMLPSER